MTPDPAKLPLRDIHLPEPVAWWPLAPGWWMLAALLLGAGVLAGGWWWLARRRRLRRAAHAELARIEQAYGANRDAHALARALSQLLRRVALVCAGPGAAALTDEDWLALLAHLAGEAWPAHLTEVLLTAPYSPQAAALLPTASCADALALTRRWFQRLPPEPRHAAV